MATLLIEKNTLNVWTHTPSDFQPYILTQFYAKSNGNNFSVFEFSGVQRGSYNFSDISIKDGLNPIETGFSSIRQVMLRLEELLYPGFDFDGEVVPADLISTDPSNKLTTGTDNKLFVPDEGVDDTADHLKGNWNASTNTPTLANGIGQIGDYYVVTNAGTQLGIVWGVGDIAAYNGSTYYKMVNNNQSPVLTTNTNITSSNLTTQDVAGFVSYINALNPIITLFDFEIRTYTVTDTGQKFEILLRGRSFGFSQPAILSSDVLELEKYDVFNSLLNGYRYGAIFWQPGTTSQTFYGVSAGLTTTGTLSATAITNSSSVTLTSAASAGSSANANASVLNRVFFANYRYNFEFSINDSVSTGRTFVGINSNFGNVGNIQPSTQTNCIGVGNDTGETVLSIMHNDGSGVCTKVSLGANYPATSGFYYTFSISNSPIGIYVRVQKYTLSFVFIEETILRITSNTPTSILLYPSYNRNNETTATAVSVIIGKTTLASIA